MGSKHVWLTRGRRGGIHPPCRRRRGLQREAFSHVGPYLFHLVSVQWKGWRVSRTLKHGGMDWIWSSPLCFKGHKMKKKNVGGSPGGSTSKHLAPMESNVFASLMSLVSHMAVTRYEDGDARRTGWITIQSLGSSWKVIAKDPDAAAQCVALAGTLDDALALMELLLSSEETPWEPDAFLAKGKKK